MTTLTLRRDGVELSAANLTNLTQPFVLGFTIAVPDAVAASSDVCDGAPEATCHYEIDARQAALVTMHTSDCRSPTTVDKVWKLRFVSICKRSTYVIV